MIEAVGLAALLTPLVFGFLLLCNSDTGPWRRSFLSASVYWGVAVTAITELLSLGQRLNPLALLSVWALLSLCSVLLLSIQRPQALYANGLSFVSSGMNAVRQQPLLGFFLAIAAVIFALTLVLALVAPPNNWDSMTYHMSRVANWIQNQSVAHYPTHTIRQLDAPPWAGFAITHLQLLSGGDRFANLVQWGSMAGCVVGVSLIAQQLKSGLSGQLIASAMALTIPMGLLQSVTTQNDYVVSFWLVCITYNVLLILDGQVTPRIIFELSSSLGLAVLTKATAYIYAFPFGLVAIAFAVKHAKVRTIKFAIWGGATAILLNLGHWWRNWNAFETLLGLSGGVTRNQLFTPAAIASNTIRNVALHASTASQTINHYIEQFVIGLHSSFLGLDINDPRTTFINTDFGIPVTPKDQPIFLNEDVSGNPVHLVFILICIGAYFAFPKARSLQRTIYLSALLTTVVLYNTVVAWQPWATRLHLPFFVLSAAFMGSVIGSLVASKWLHRLLIFGLSLSALPYVLFSAVRPLTSSSHFLTFTSSVFNISRFKRRFTSQPTLADAYSDAIESVLEYDCRDVGLYLGGEVWDYPLWVIAQDKSPRIRFRAVEVSNASRNISSPSIRGGPCAVLVAAQPKVTRRRIGLKSIRPDREVLYLRVMRSRNIQVFVKRRLVRESKSP